MIMFAGLTSEIKLKQYTKIAFRVNENVLFQPSQNT